jgi:hypothetical protein
VTRKNKNIPPKKPQLVASTAAPNGFTVKVAIAEEHPDDARRMEAMLQLLLKLHAEEVRRPRTKRKAA